MMTHSSSTSSSDINLSEEDMAKIKNKVLEVLRTHLVDHIDPRSFITYLRAHTVLDQRECDEIKSASGRSRCEGAEKFLDILARKGSRGYDQFCNAIMRDKTQMFLLTALNKKVELYKDYRKKQIAKDYELWKKEQELQQNKQIHLLTQHKQSATPKHPHLLAGHTPQFTTPTHIYYPPNYQYDELSVSQPPYRARSPVPFVAVGTYNEINTPLDHQAHVFQEAPQVVNYHQPWSQHQFTPQHPPTEAVVTSLPQDSMIDNSHHHHQHSDPYSQQLQPPLQIARDHPTGEGGQ